MKVPSGLEFYILVGALGVGAVLGLGYLAKRGASAAADAVSNTVANTASAVNPFNTQNVFASTANKLTSTLTGDQGQTLGGWLYDITH